MRAERVLGLLGALVFALSTCDEAPAEPGEPQLAFEALSDSVCDEVDLATVVADAGLDVDGAVSSRSSSLTAMTSSARCSVRVVPDRARPEQAWDVAVAIETGERELGDDTGELWREAGEDDLLDLQVRDVDGWWADGVQRAEEHPAVQGGFRKIVVLTLARESNLMVSVYVTNNFMASPDDAARSGRLGLVVARALEPTIDRARVDP